MSERVRRVVRVGNGLAVGWTKPVRRVQGNTADNCSEGGRRA